MNILISVCGFGNGHSARQAHVVEALLRRGHQLALFGFMNSERYFKQHYPQLPLFPLRVPIIHVSSQVGIDFGRSAVEPLNIYDDGNAVNFAAMQGALDYFGGKPDLIISDYELVAAQLAYAIDTPFVTLDQHSKFMGYQFPAVNGYSRIEERSRLGMFFPDADLRLACSFFDVPWPKDPKFDVQLIPPILREALLALTPIPADSATPEIIVYISPHGATQQSPSELYEIFTHFPQKKFVVYGSIQPDSYKNVIFRGYESTPFLHALTRAEAVITTAGHNLLSELAYLKKPVYTLPFPFFEQQCCADMVQRLQIGVGTEQLSVESLSNFFDDLSLYQHNLNVGNGLTPNFNGLEVAIEALHQQFGV